MLIGLPALRIQGLYLAVTTLAFAVALDSYFLNPINFPDHVPDRIVRPVLWKRFDLASQWIVYYLCLATLAGRGARRAVAAPQPCRAGDDRRARQRAGRRRAVGADDAREVADLRAVRLPRRPRRRSVRDHCRRHRPRERSSPPCRSQVFSFAVIGGLGSVAGVIAGVASFRLVDFVLAKGVEGDAADVLRLSLSGGGLLLVLYFLPGGLWQFVQRRRDRLLRRLADRRGVLVPSLVADKRVDDADAPEDETEVIAGALR